MKDGKPWEAFGVMGGGMQPQGHVQVLANQIDFGMGVQEAGDAARWQHEGDSEPTDEKMTNGGYVNLESGIPWETVRELKKRGHEVRFDSGGYGGYQAIKVEMHDGQRSTSAPVRAGKTGRRRDIESGAGFPNECLIMKIAAAQISCAVGDVGANLAKIRDFSTRAKASGADWIVFPEWLTLATSCQRSGRTPRSGAREQCQSCNESQRASRSGLSAALPNARAIRFTTRRWSSMGMERSRASIARRICFRRRRLKSTSASRPETAQSLCRSRDSASDSASAMICDSRSCT